MREQVERARDGDLAGARAQDVLHHPQPPAARAGVVSEGVARAELEDAEAGQVHRVGGDGEQLVGAAQGRAARLLRFLEQAVHVTDEGAIAAAAQDGVVALVEHLPRDAPRIVEAARIVEVLRRHEVLERALEAVGDVPRIRVQEHRDLFGSADWEALDVAHWIGR